MSAIRSTIGSLRMRELPSPLIALGLAVLLFIIGGILNPSFFNLAQAINIVRLAAFLGMIAAGQTLVIISGGEGIDLSVGAVVTLGAIIVFRVAAGANLMAPVALAAALFVGLAIGAVNGFGIVLLRIPPLVMTLAMAGVVQGVILIASQGQFEGRTPPLMGTLISEPLLGPIPGVIIVWLLFGLAMWALLNRTAYGKKLYAVGTNRMTARLSGIRVPRVIIVTYALSGALAALGGFMLLGFTKTVYFNLGAPYLFPSIAAVVVGGTVLAGGRGSYWGTMAGAIVLTLLESLLRSMRLQEAYQLIILGAVLVLLLSVYGRQRALRL